MTCAACSARVDKAARSVEGVNDVVVNLLKNSMDVDFEGGPDVVAAISGAVEKAGYGAYPRVNDTAGTSGATPGASSQGSPRSENVAAREAAAVKRRLVISFVFTIPLFYISMGHMFGWPLPDVLLGPEHVMILALTEFLLLVPVIFVNFKFFRVGFKSLFHLAPNMDSLIALGSGASTLYGI